MRSYPGGREADADLRKQLGSVHQLSARAGAPGSEGVTTDDLIGRLTAIADNPEVGAAAKIRAIEVIHRVQRDSKQGANPAERKRDELRARRLAKAK